MNSVLSDLYEGKIFPAEEHSSKSEIYWHGAFWIFRNIYWRIPAGRKNDDWSFSKWFTYSI